MGLPPRRDRHLLDALLLVVAVAAAYWNALSAGLVLDAPSIIGQDARIQRFEWVRLRDVFLGDYWGLLRESGLYRPLTTLSYAIQYSLLGAGARAAPYVFGNLALHALNVVLFAAVLRRIGVRRTLALVAGLLWAVHPLNTEAVTNVVGRADLLAAAGVLIGLRLHAGSPAASFQLWRSAGLLLASALAIGAKESGAVLIGVLVLHDVVFGAAERATAPSRTAWWLARVRHSYAWVVVPLLAWAALRAYAAGHATPPHPADNPLVLLGPVAGRVAAVALLCKYPLLLVWPARLSADYSWNELPVTAPGFVAIGGACAVLAAGAVAVAARVRRRAPIFAFLVLAFFVTIAPVANVFVFIGTVFGERLAYLPSALLLALVVQGADRVRERFDSTRVRAATATVVAAALVLGVVRSNLRNRDWRSSLDLFASAVEAAPGSFKAHNSFAANLFLDAQQRGDLPARIDVALEHARRAREILGGLPLAAWPSDVLANLAALEHAKATVAPESEAAAWRAKARAEYEEALRLEGELLRAQGASAGAGNWRLRVGLADVLLESGERDAALEAYTKAAELAPGPEVLVRLAAALRDASRFRDAVVTALRVVLLDANATAAWDEVERSYAALVPGATAIVRSPGGARRLDTAQDGLRDLLVEAARSQYAAMVRLGQARAAEGFRLSVRGATGIDAAK